MAKFTCKKLSFILIIHSSLHYIRLHYTLLNIMSTISALLLVPANNIRNHSSKKSEILFDHPLAEGQEKSEFAKQIQGFFLAFSQGVVILFFVGVFFFSQYDHLEGAHSFAQFLRQISSFSCYFLETLTETGSIHWVGVSYIFGKLMTNGMQWWVVHDILGSLGGH